MKIRTAFVLGFLAAAAARAAAQDQQLGARTKAMGGSYTAFEDDPVSVWLNPAGIATQPDQLSIAYQTYTGYPRARERGPGDTIEFSVNPRLTQGNPAYWPSYIGAVFQLGSGDSPMSLGICFARPYLLDYALDQVTNPADPNNVPEAEVEETFSRFRVAFAKDFVLGGRGDGAWFTHLSAGVGLDVGWVQWSFTGPSEQTSDTASGLGGGLGLLLGLYESDTFKVNVGVAYQSAVNYRFRTETSILPAFDMPQQVNVGVSFYVGTGMPLRITLDTQWIEWSATAEKPLYAGFREFQDAINVSVGVEYRLKVAERVNLYPRLGYRRFDAPWGNKNDLPMTAGYRLVLDTKANVFNIVTYGLGVGWTTPEGKTRTLDIASDVGGDTVNFAIGITYEF